MTADIQLRLIARPHLDLLSAMYDRFDPLGAALGLPPRSPEVRRTWVGRALSQIVNVAAFSSAGEVVGHCFMVADAPASAEIAVFVHQECRRRGIGAALLSWVLEWGRAAQMERVWAIAPSENQAAFQLLRRCGFRVIGSDFGVSELHIDLRILTAGNWVQIFRERPRHAPADVTPGLIEES